MQIDRLYTNIGTNIQRVLSMRICVQSTVFFSTLANRTETCSGFCRRCQCGAVVLRRARQANGCSIGFENRTLLNWHIRNVRRKGQIRRRFDHESCIIYACIIQYR